MSKVCGKNYDEVLPVADYQQVTKCPMCGEPGKKVIQYRQIEPTFSEKIFPMYDPNLGKYVGSSRDRERIMKEMGVVSLEGRRRTTAKQEAYAYRQRAHLKPPI